MAITDINISEQLETSAPSIKYRGNEGPKSPQEQMQMAGPDRYFKIFEFMLNELEGELGRELTDEEYEEVGRRAMDEFQQSGGQPLPQDPTKPVNPFAPKPTGPVLPDRQMAAYGGIMGMDGRRQYGIGSSLKKAFRKIIPNEVAQIAETAAPFVAPFNPLAAGLMSGIGGFDRTGRIGSSLKSGLINYGMGNVARMMGGAGFQGGLKSKAMAGQKGLGSYFTSPTSGARLFGGAPKANVSNTIPVDNKQMHGKNYTIDNATGEVVMRPDDLRFNAIEHDKLIFKPENLINNTGGGELKSKIMEYVPTSLADLTNVKKLIGGAGIVTAATMLLGGGEDETVSAIMDRGEGMDVEAIRTEVQAAFADKTGEKLAALRVKYPFLGRADTKDFAMGGRIGMAEGGIMDLGGMEKDYRAEGGFVPIGKEEKADDVPARLSVNEFVFTADAVRNAGGGDIDKGAEVMENMMKHLEQGGQVSEESQGMAGAQQMFETSERLSEVI